MDVSVEEQNAASIALKKYRRIKTIVNKAEKTADICDVMINVIIYDAKMHRLKEYYSSNEIKL